MGLDLPVIYLLPTHLTADELHHWEERIPSITWDASEADFIVGKISNKLRAQFELRKLKLPTAEPSPVQDGTFPRAKRRKMSDAKDNALFSYSPTDLEFGTIEAQDPTVKVVRLAWLDQSISKGEVQDYRDFLIYEATKVSTDPIKEPNKITALPTTADLLRRAKEVADTASQTLTTRSDPHRRHKDRDHVIRAPPLLPQTTTDEGVIANFPFVPTFLKTTYSCQRPTRVHPPNEGFIEKLKEVRELRAMTGDNIGVRAYSSAIASLSAYPFKLQSSLEISRLPGCGDRIAALFAEFESVGELAEIQAAASDEKTSAIRTFYNIWGVSAATAEEFYRKGWRELDDVVDYGWKSISRSQQIGVKYYDEFLQKITRSETEKVANTVLRYALQIREGFQMMVVGGYRRGKAMCGDVDIMLSHPDEDATRDFISRLVTELEDAKFITHTLTVSTANSERFQRPTAYKAGASAGSGFDTLDKALVVWQEPKFEPSGSVSPKNPNPHRRVDIIISPWKTVGCAVLGWTSETTFQRDLRRYCKYEKNLKFDSSGVRTREQPFDWVDLENGENGRAETMEEAEKRVFEGLGLEYRSPEERCTG